MRLGLSFGQNLDIRYSLIVVQLQSMKGFWLNGQKKEKICVCMFLCGQLLPCIA